MKSLQAPILRKRITPPKRGNFFPSSPSFLLIGNPLTSLIPPASNRKTYTPLYFLNNTAGPFTFTKFCSTTFSGLSNIDSASVTTFDHCIEMCAHYNYYHDYNATCQGVAYTLPGFADRNCWILEGGVTGGGTPQTGTDSAIIL
jgi:hypothetical protein